MHPSKRERRKGWTETMAQYVLFHQRETPGGPIRNLVGMYETRETANDACVGFEADKRAPGFYAVVEASVAKMLHIKV